MDLKPAPCRQQRVDSCGPLSCDPDSDDHFKRKHLENPEAGVLCPTNSATAALLNPHSQVRDCCVEHALFLVDAVDTKAQAPRADADSREALARQPRSDSTRLNIKCRRVHPLHRGRDKLLPILWKWQVESEGAAKPQVHCDARCFNVHPSPLPEPDRHVVRPQGDSPPRIARSVELHLQTEDHHPVRHDAERLEPHRDR